MSVETSAMEASIRLHLRTLKLPTIAREFLEIERRAIAEQWEPKQYLRALLDAELAVRSDHAIERRLRAARLPSRKTLSQFDWSRPHGLDARRVDDLARCNWIETARNIVLLGPVGTGKTHLAIALTIEAIRRSHNATFFRASDLVRVLREARDGRELGRLRERLQRCSVLVIDELGFVPFDKDGGELLFDVLSARHEKRATIITSNLVFSEWHRVFGDEKLTAALLDRLAQYADVLVTKGAGDRMARRNETATVTDPSLSAVGP